MRKHVEYIREELDTRELLEQLAEESAELSQAALKLIRADKRVSRNSTPLSYREARENLTEEILDVLLVLRTLGIIPKTSEIEDYWKSERWAERLGYSD